MLPVGLQAESVKSLWHESVEADSPHNCRPEVEAFVSICLGSLLLAEQ